ncbi:MAG TPA: STM3941 family protein [Stellaceae bacterium]|jgi:hypothetical protein|nr:STM3941 family protein [Stellaceae bacterium]
MSEQNQATALPERLILTLDRSYISLLSLGSVALVALGIFLVDHQRNFVDAFWGWASIVFFGLCAVAGVLDLIAPRLSYIELTRDGFRIVYLLRRQRVPTPWREIAAIEVYRWYSGGWPRYGVRMASARLGHKATTVTSPRMFGYGAQELAALMTRFHDRARQSESRG